MDKLDMEELERAVSLICSYCEELCGRCEDCPVYKIYGELCGGRI